jgi:hypothetical protein
MASYGDDKMETESITQMIGKTPVKIYECPHGEEIVFTFSDGSKAKFYHEQDCCESVIIEDVNGDWNDLIGNPLLVADERISHDEPNGYDSDTWTFYTFRGIGGSVDVRWHGSSNGYYSESVHFHYEEAK